MVTRVSSEKPRQYLLLINSRCWPGSWTMRLQRQRLGTIAQVVNNSKRTGFFEDIQMRVKSDFIYSVRTVALMGVVFFQSVLRSEASPSVPAVPYKGESTN